jgi:hypothetical protein
MEMMMMFLALFAFGAVIGGTRFTAGTQGVAADRIITDLGDVLLLQPNKAPLVVLTSKLRKKTLVSPNIEWQEDDLHPNWDTVDTGTSATDTTELHVHNSGYFHLGDVIKVPRTGDMMRVSTTPASTTTVTVTRISGNNTIATDEPLLILGSAFYEGDDKSPKRGTSVATVTNFTQIFKKSFALSETLKATKLHGGPELPRQRKKQAIELAQDLENSLLYGVRGAVTTGTSPIRFAGGLTQYITTNAVSVGGVLTQTKVDDLSEKCFNFGNGSKKLLVCGSCVINGINRLATGKLELVPSDKTYGVTIQRWLTGYGELQILHHWLLTGAIYGGYAFMLDLENIEFGELRGVQYKEHVEDNGADEQQDELKCEAGWLVKQEKTHGYLYGVTG